MWTHNVHSSTLNIKWYSVLYIYRVWVSLIKSVEISFFNLFIHTFSLERKDRPFFWRFHFFVLHFLLVFVRVAKKPRLATFYHSTAKNFFTPKIFLKLLLNLIRQYCTCELHRFGRFVLVFFFFFLFCFLICPQNKYIRVDLSFVIPISLWLIKRERLCQLRNYTKVWTFGGWALEGYSGLRITPKTPFYFFLLLSSSRLCNPRL